MRTIVVLHTRRGRSSTWRYLEDWGYGIASRVIPATYERFASACDRFLATGRLPRGFGLRPRLTIRLRRVRNREGYPARRFPHEDLTGAHGYTVVFTDLERIPEVSMGPVFALWKRLADASHDVRLLNDPHTPKKRVPLLCLLHERGINEFGVYPIEGGEIPRPRSFPVFVREANDHLGPVSGLLQSQDELARWTAEARSHDRLPATPLVTEFVDTADPEGTYRKYGAFRIGGAIVPAHVHVADSWAVKIGNSEPDPKHIEEEWNYVRTNPHENDVMRAFELARTEYGRMDYAMRDGRIQVFEINTSPTLLFPGDSKNAVRGRRKEYVGRRLHDAFAALVRAP